MNAGKAVWQAATLKEMSGESVKSPSDGKAGRDGRLLAAKLERLALLIGFLNKASIQQTIHLRRVT